MKKIIALVLAAVMTFALASTAFAGQRVKESFSFWDTDFQIENPISNSEGQYKLEAEINGIKLTITDSAMFYVPESERFESYLYLVGISTVITVEAPEGITLHEISFSIAACDKYNTDPGYNSYLGLHNNYWTYQGQTTQEDPNDFTLKIDGVAKDMTDIQANANWQYEEYIGEDFTKAVAASSTACGEVSLKAVTIVYTEEETTESTTATIPSTSADVTTADVSTTAADVTTADASTTAAAATTAKAAASATATKTGDSSNAVIWIAIGGVAIIGIATVFILKRKK